MATFRKRYNLRRISMSTTAEAVDAGAIKQAIQDVRSDKNGVNRTAWVIVGHVDNNPNLIDVLHSDTSAEASMDDFRSHLADDQVMYGLLRLSSSVDMSSTVKFIYVHWSGEMIPFAKKGRFGVVHGSVEEHFNPFHILLETGNIDDLEEEELTQKLEESSGQRSKIVEGPVAGRQERGFTQHQLKRTPAGDPRCLAPAGAAVEVSPELNEAIGHVRSDNSATSWVLAGYEGGNIRNPLVVVSEGTDDVEELKEHLKDDQVMYALYRTTDLIDDIKTIKFVYIYWVGEDTKPLTKGKVSALAGPVEQIFSPVHANLVFTNRYDIDADLIRDKVMAGSGSKSFVMA